MTMRRRTILSWLRATEPRRLEQLWRRTDVVRQAHVGPAVHLRGLVEISNHCTRLCTYCGLRAPNRRVQRYRMTVDEVVACAHKAVALGYGTVVLQSGEDPAWTVNTLSTLVARIKAETPLAITLSLGERPRAELAAWRAAGADRYLLRFETSNAALLKRIHPPRRGVQCDRLALVSELRELGYEVGSGVMVGIPGQGYEDLATDLELFRRLDLDMIGVGPFLPHPDTPLGGAGAAAQAAGGQVPNSELMTYKVLALARLLCPKANIPSTTALATLNHAAGRELGLVRGANVVMPNLTPMAYRACYEIYPAKACLQEQVDEYDAYLKGRIAAIGREVGCGQGSSPNWRTRQVQTAPDVKVCNA